MAPEAFLWPVVVVPSSASGSLLATVLAFATRSAAVVAGPRGALYLGVELGLLGVALSLWVADGRPLPRRSRGVDPSA